MRPLTAFVLAEFAVLVVLAVWWLGGTGNAANAADPHERAPDAAPGAAAPAAAPVADAAANPGAAPTAREAAAPAVPALAANDPIGIVLSGSVRSADGQPVEGNVYLSRMDVHRGGESAAPGSYAIAGLQPGEWTLTCRAEDFTPLEQTITLDDRAFQQLDLTLQRSYLVRVKVLGADGASIYEEVQKKSMWGAPYVVATEQPLANDLPPTTQSSLLRFGIAEWKGFRGISARDVDPKLLAQGYAGELRLHRAPPAYASLLLRTTLLQSQRIEPGQQELVFTIEAKDVLAKHGSVRMRLLDASGAPIPGLRPSVRTAQGGGAYGKSGDDGAVVIENVVPGMGILELMTGAERESLFRHVRVPAGGTVDLGDITLGAGEKIVGTVLGADGKPVNGASIQWTELDSRTFAQPLVSNRSAAADAEGKFQLWGCGRHRYAVRASVQGGGLGVATVDARNGAPPDLRITLGTPMKVALRVNVPPTEGFVVTVLASDRSPIAVATIAAEYRPSSLSLLPGSYTVEIHDMRSDRLARSFALTVGSEPLTIDVP